MKRINTRTKIPFVVSVTLISAYSVLTAAVPPSAVSLDGKEHLTMVVTPDVQATVKVLTRANATRASDRQAVRLLQ